MICETIDKQIEQHRQRYGHDPKVLRLCPDNYRALQMYHRERFGDEVIDITVYLGMDVKRVQSRYTDFGFGIKQTVCEVV